MNKRLLTVVFLICSLGTAIAQQDAQYTQYMYNTQVVNPAYAGSRGVFSMAALYRAQWAGVDGAPTTQTLTLNTPVSNRVGIGLSVVNDEIGNGTVQNSYFDTDFSYTIPISEISKLSFGIKAGGHLLDVNLANLKNYNPQFTLQDNGNIDKKFSPNFGAGVFYHTDSFYVGLSVPNFLKTKHFETSEGSSSFLVVNKMQYYLISGLVIDLNYNLKFKPSVLLKATAGAPLHADFSANFLLNNQFSFGMAYRWDAAISGLIGFQISDRVMLGMAYDREVSDLGGTQFNDGSFEFFIRYELKSRHRKTVNARFF